MLLLFISFFLLSLYFCNTSIGVPLFSPTDKGMPTSPGYPQPSMNYLRPEDQYRPSHQPSAVEPNNYFLSSQHSRYMPGYTVGSSRMSPGTANPMSVGGPNQPFNHPDSRLCPPSSPYVQQQSQESHAPPSTDISREERQKCR